MYKLCKRCVGTCNVLPLSTMVEAVPFNHTVCFWVSNLLFHGDTRAINQNLCCTEKTFNFFPFQEQHIA